VCIVQEQCMTQAARALSREQIAGGASLTALQCVSTWGAVTVLEQCCPKHREAIREGMARMSVPEGAVRQ
jgi:hypothetical protein